MNMNKIILAAASFALLGTAVGASDLTSTETDAHVQAVAAEESAEADSEVQAVSTDDSAETDSDAEAASAEESDEDTEDSLSYDENDSEEIDETGRVPQKTWEIQADYMEHHFFSNRYIDNYSLHAYRYMGHHGTISWYQGFTITRNDGYITTDHRHRDSRSWGLGPSVMGRYERHLTGKLYGSFDATGSLLFYNDAFPAGGRAFGFMWRFGPRLTYKFNEDSSISAGYLFMHCSNGMSDRNPGYNAKGISIAYSTVF
jgi:hypothetical protein